MPNSRTQQLPMKLTLNNRNKEQLETYTYLGTTVNKKKMGSINRNKNNNGRSAKSVQQYEKVGPKQNLNEKIKTGQKLGLSSLVLWSRRLEHNGSHLEEIRIL